MPEEHNPGEWWRPQVASGRGTQRNGVSEKFGLRMAANEAGEDLLQWCEANSMALVNSFMKLETSEQRNVV